MKTVFFILLLICNLLVCNYLQAKEPFIRKISYREGLSTEVIYDLFTDSKGYLYLGTDKGLIRYNGHEFKKIPIKGNLANAVNNISEDAKGQIWCKNFSNQMFCLKNDTLRSIPVLQEIISKESNLREFCISGNFIWIAMQYKILRYDIRNNEIVLIKAIEADSHQNQFYDIKCKGETVLFSDIHNLYEYKIGAETNVILNYKGQKNICIHNNGIFFSNRSDKMLMDVKKKRLLSIEGVSDKAYFHYFVSTGEKLWLCTSDGLYNYSNGEKPDISVILSGLRISDIIRDHEGNYWLSTLDDGLYFLPHPDIRFVRNRDISGTEKIKFNRLSSGPDNSFFIGSNQGTVFHCDEKGNLKKAYVSKMNSEIDFLYFDSLKNKLYHSYGLIDLKRKDFENYISYGKDLCADDMGNFLVSTYSMAALISQEKEKMPNFKDADNLIQQSFAGVYSLLSLNEVRTRVSYYSGKFQKYYLGSSDGLKAVDKNNRKRDILLSDGSRIIAIDILEDQNGNIWVSSLQNGLFKIRDLKVIDHFTAYHGLSSNNCGKITVYGETLWVITDEGINSLNINSGIIRDISSALALIGLQFNDIMVRGNQIWLAAGDGIVKIPASIITEYAKPQIFLNNFIVKGKVKDSKKPVPYSENDIFIDFDAIHYKSWGRYSFRYRLLGLDSSWQSEDIHKKHLNFLSLAPGSYRFQVQAYASGVYSDILELPFVVSKPFWQRIWFFLLAFTCSLFFVYLLYKITLNRIRKKQQIKEQLALSQLTALRAQMNPHFMFNILNAVQGLIYAGKKYDASSYLGKFSDLMRKTLEMSDKQEILLSKEIEALKLYVELEAGRFDDNLHFNINIDQTIVLDDIKIPSMIVQPFVENAIKHGLMHKNGDKLLNVSISKIENNSIEICVDDNGIGRKASEKLNKLRKKHQSFATEAIDSRVNLLNRIREKPIIIDITDKVSESGAPTGTFVKITIPINK